MQNVELTRIDDFVCPACGEIIKQVVARDGVVRGWCPQAKKPINVVVTQVKEETTAVPVAPKPMSHLEILKQQREKVLRDMVSAREDGDLKENSAYHAARDELSKLDFTILKEQERLRNLPKNN